MISAAITAKNRSEIMGFDREYLLVLILNNGCIHNFGRNKVKEKSSIFHSEFPE